MALCIRPFTLIALLAFSSLSAAAAVRAVAQRDRVGFWLQPGGSQKPVGALKKNTIVDVVSKSADGAWLRVNAPRTDGTSATGWVRTQDFAVESSGVQDAAGLEDENDEDVQPAHAAGHPPHPIKHWSIGGSIGGSATSTQSVFVVMTDVRYAWSMYTESILGLDFTFGSNTFVGFRVAQRLYAPLESVRPYVQVGFRRFQMTESLSGAYELGAGFQVASFGPDTYFELGAVYLIRTPFDEFAANTFIFNGGIGKRF